ncbi:MAG: hypothetical protein RL226_1123 [Bacteroidota bacterium]|jgi:hypothetical protein
MTSSTFFQRRQERLLIGLKINDTSETLDFTTNSNFAYSSNLKKHPLHPFPQIHKTHLIIPPLPLSLAHLNASHHVART